MDINITEQLEALKRQPPKDIDTVSCSNAMQLGAVQWAALALFMAAGFALAPGLWTKAERFELDPDYRMPYDLSKDYFHFGRVARAAAAKYDAVLLGDSVVWGQYVARPQTLSHFLNERAGGQRFANLGLDGAHPAALAGLVEDYAGAVRGKKVVLQCNPLWMSSPKHDLQVEEEFKFNHPALVPQFSPPIPCYRENPSARIGILIDREVPFRGWTGHLQYAYYESKSVPEWTIEHPRENPLKPLTLRLPPSDDTLRHSPISWVERGIKRQEFAWVPLEKSFQWKSFLRALDLLRSRGNEVLVVVGPFNEHMLGDASRAVHESLKRGIERELRARGVACVVPPLLPSEEYADASHPLAAGYKRVADHLWTLDFFRGKP